MLRMERRTRIGRHNASRFDPSRATRPSGSHGALTACAQKPLAMRPCLLGRGLVYELAPKLDETLIFILKVHSVQLQTVPVRDAVGIMEAVRYCQPCNWPFGGSRCSGSNWCRQLFLCTRNFRWTACITIHTVRALANVKCPSLNVC